MNRIIKEIEWFLWWLIAITVIGVILTNGGCSTLTKFMSGSDAITIAPAPTPGQQLWQTAKKSNWLVTLAIPIIAMGAVAMFNGAVKLGMSSIIFGSVNLFMALATSRFAFWMALFGLLGSGLAVAASILAKNVALREIITGTQTLKDYSVEQYKGNRSGINRLLTDKQKHKSTQKIVQKIKSNLKLKGKL